jgi:hypothetical protein
LGQRLDLDRIAKLRAGPVRFDILKSLRTKTELVVNFQLNLGL